MAFRWLGGTRVGFSIIAQHNSPVMPKKRPNSTKSEPHVLASSAHNDPLPIAPLVVLAGLILLELFLYFCDAPDLHLKQRWSSLNFLSAPDELFVMWCGGKIANFSLLDRWPIFLLTGLILLGAWLAGILSLAAIGLTRLLTRLEQHVFALAAGLNLLSLYALAVGLAGGLHHRWLFLAPLIALAAVFVWQRLTRRAQMARTEPGESLTVENDPRWLWCLVIAVPFAAALFLGSMLPPWDYDVREYHLQSPKEWFQNGRIISSAQYLRQHAARL